MSPTSSHTPVRIAHLLAQRGLCSRREGEKWVAAGRIRVNGSVVTNPATVVVPAKDEVLVDGEPLPTSQKHIYIALNKPAGVLSTFTKSREKGFTLDTVVKLERRLFPAGRLDRDSKGLLILTTDGDWANQVMHPRYEKSKEYLVRFRKIRPTPAAKRMAQASFSERGRTFRAAEVKPEGSYVRVVLKEGRNRQIRRLAEAAGLEVRELIRIRVGPIQLGALKEGKYRKLNRHEIDVLMDEK